MIHYLSLKWSEREKEIEEERERRGPRGCHVESEREGKSEEGEGGGREGERVGENKKERDMVEARKEVPHRWCGAFSLVIEC